MYQYDWSQLDPEHTSNIISKETKLLCKLQQQALTRWFQSDVRAKCVDAMFDEYVLVSIEG